MKKLLSEEKIPLVIISILYAFVFVLTYAHCGDILIDCGREAYIPYAISKGQALFKDIFCIYGPFPYLFNAFFLKVIATNLATFYVIGAVFGFIYVLGVYLCSREFLSKKISTILCALLIFSVIFDSTIFNFIFPYSYAIVFSATFSIWILYFLIKYIQDKKSNYLHYMAILWGAIYVSKVDFIPIIFAIVPIILVFEKNKRQEIIKFLLYALIIPSLTYLILFTQGVTIADILKNTRYLSQMVNTDSFRYFYSHLSVMTFNFANFVVNIKSLISTLFICLIFFCVSLFALRRRNKFVKYGLLILMFVFCLAILIMQETKPQMIFVALPYISTVAFLFILYKYIKLKDFKNSETVCYLAIFAFAILTSIKNFHALLLGFYGSYSLAIPLICTTILIKELLKNNAIYNTKRHYEWTLFSFLTILTLIFIQQLTINVINENATIITKFGKIKTNLSLAQPFKETLSFLNTHSTNSKSILVMPEGIMLNFLSGKKHDFYQTSFIPLDFDTFKDENIISEISDKKPDLIIFTSRNTAEYGKTMICKNYGTQTCSYVISNYTPEAAFGDEFRMYIFKKKETDNNE